MPANTDIQKRYRATFALLMLTGICDGALITMRLKHIDLETPREAVGEIVGHGSGRMTRVVRNPCEVATKYGKPIDTFFVNGFPEAGFCCIKLL